MCTGSCSEDLPPSPNDQVHDVGTYVVVSMNCTEWGTAVPLVEFAVNDAIGAVAPATAGRKVSPAARIRKSHTVSCFMLVIQALGGNRPGERVDWYVGPVMIPDETHGYLLSVHRGSDIMTPSGE